MDDKEAKVLSEVTLKLKELAGNNTATALGYVEFIRLSMIVEAFQPFQDLVQAKEAVDKFVKALKDKRDKSFSKDK